MSTNPTPPVTLPWPEDEPCVRLWPTAAGVFQISRATAYTLAARGEFPTPTFKLGAAWLVRTADLRRALGLPVSPHVEEPQAS
jgi:hypothetical protein